MTVKEIREKAKTLNLKNISKLSKEHLIRGIQKAEGNADCFKQLDTCGQTDCCWRPDCQD